MSNRTQSIPKCFVLLSIVLFLFDSSVLAQNSPALGETTWSVNLPVRTYEELLSAIRQTRVASRKRIERAVDQEKVREAWETGRLIDEHILHHQKRAGYEEYVMDKLSVDLAISDSELYRMLKFSRLYPEMAPGPLLSWSHYRALVTVEDSKVRKDLEERSLREKWTRDKMRSEVKKVKHTPDKETILTAQPGKLYTYRVIKAAEGPFNSGLVLDLGFSNYYQPEKIHKFKVGDIVTLEKGKLKKTADGLDALFTYQAYLIEIVDGDTIKAVIDLGFKIATVQTLRLRGLDAPEIESSEGKEAKEFLLSVIASGAKQSQKDGIASSLGSTPRNDGDLDTRPHALSSSRLPADTAGPVVIRTVKSDKYDRYLADLFVNGEYVNQKLVAEGLATVVED